MKKNDPAETAHEAACQAATTPQEATEAIDVIEVQRDGRRQKLPDIRMLAAHQNFTALIPEGVRDTLAILLGRALTAGAVMLTLTFLSWRI